MFTLVVPAAAQQTAAQPRKNAARAPFVEVRFALSDAAKDKLPSSRFRRYLTIELDDTGHVAAKADGPLGDEVAYVWVDVPKPDTIEVQVRVGGHRIARRTFTLRAGTRDEVAARLVALITAEMVRASAKPERVRRARPPKPITPDEVEAATRLNPAILLAAQANYAWLPSADANLFGTSLQLAFRTGGVRELLTGRFLGGPSDAGTLRWFELGLGADYTTWLGSHWRMSAGAAAAAATLGLRDVQSVDAIDGQRTTWSARAGLPLLFETSVARSVWLGAGVEPAVILRPADYVLDDGRAGRLEGFWLGLNLSLQFEQRLQAKALTHL